MFFDFEKPIQELTEQLEKANETHAKGKVNMTETIDSLVAKINETKKNIYSHLTGWQKVQISRHPDRPYTLDYIDKMCTNFVELHGDRNIKDDKAMVCGFA